MRHELHTQIDIDAPPEIVWDILTDLDNYSDWNPFIVSSSGEVAVGERLVNRMKPPEGRAVTFKPTVTEVVSGQTFEWLGRLVMPGVFDGRHRFELTGTSSGGTHLAHSERFNGMLVRFMRKWLDTNTKRGFEALDDALKDRAEAFVSSES